MAMMSNPIDEADAREVLKLRYWQHLINEMLKEKGNFKIPIHLAFGHEAAAVAARSVSRAGRCSMP